MKRGSLLFAAALSAFAVAPAVAQREPVLKQVSVPHTYYWREMYIPQLTAGPSGADWVDDNRLVLSMAGRLWLQGAGSTTARQITSGRGYDYQPDVAANGRFVAFTRYLDDAFEIVVQDLKTGREEQITGNGAVNVDPRWSPDGESIAYVTTVDSGEFHIAIAERDERGWTSRRWRPERTSDTPRYYYSQTDHELSPVWTPDGESLVFIANPETGHGTGPLWRQPVDLSAPAMLLRDEETSWGLAPDLAPDGKRIAYSSYLGRQWRQLWLIKNEEGSPPIPWTYGEFDAKRPRWSPDGRRIAFIANERGVNELRIMEVIGGATRAIETAKRIQNEKVGSLALSVFDENGAPLAARVMVRGADGRDYAPDDAMIHADDGFDRSVSWAEPHYFHTDGREEIALPSGEAIVTVWRGLGAPPVVRKIAIDKGKLAALEISLPVMPEAFADWVSADVHTHMNYGGAYRMTPALYAAQADAEGLDIAFNLIVNKEQRIPDIDYFTPEPMRYEGADAVVVQAQEFHTSVWGHLGLLGLKNHILISDYAGYPGTAAHSLYPDNTTMLELARAQGAVTGYVHPYDPPAPDPSGEGRLSHALPVDAALGTIDYIEVVGFSDHRTVESVWRRLLNCGFRIAAAGGMDAMTNYASLRGPMGVNRTYVELKDRPEGPAALVDAWLSGLKGGRSFATNGPLVSLEVEGLKPGETLKLPKGGGRISFSGRLNSIVPVDRLEVIVNDGTVMDVPLKDGLSTQFSGAADVTESGWILVRAMSAEAHPLLFDGYAFAVTTPVYIEVGGKPARSREDADYFIAWIRRLEAFAEASDAWNTPEEKQAVLANFARARREFERRR